MPSRKFELDQHFLKSPRFALMLIGHSNVRKNDIVVEIGAGTGVITTALAKRCKKVYAIEPDPETADRLRANLARYKIENVVVLEQDFRTVEFPSEPFKVFSNPPFRFSAEIFYKLLGLSNENGDIVQNGAKNPPKSIYLILQKNLALKLIPTDRHYTSKLGKILQSNYDAKIRLPLKRTDFTPPPAVDTVLFEAKLRSLSSENLKLS